ncbi:sigma 54-interacting transcriptional regulator [Clostridium sediminicola]|uniref:sigma 54-interacting transcriptional regulator n=1 Tax=Clostridium sediminicola TaxID=3114879 RepID=UPI0031F2488B
MENLKECIGDFVDVIDESVVVFDNKCNITKINKSAKRLLGINTEQNMKSGINEIISKCNIFEIIESGKKVINKDIKINQKKLSVNIIPMFNCKNTIEVLVMLREVKEYNDLENDEEKEKLDVDILYTMMNTVNEWVVVVDKDGLITMMSKAYKEFLNKYDVEGKHVTEIIDNTRMHVVLDTGEKEIGELQEINGNKMIAMRIPIIKDGRVVAAVGKAMFKDISDFYSISKKISNLERKIEYYKNELGKERTSQYCLEDIIGNSSEITKVKKMAARVAKTDSNVLIFGESGTGKELFAHSIHTASKRASAPFIQVNCAAIPAQLLESELFGYEEGAFTGAKKGGKKGKFELANKGTILLDEIGDMPMDMQVKLLRVIQEREIERVGGNILKNIDVRIIASTNKDLEQSIVIGEFREDLYYRLNVMKLIVPPLRERRDDIIQLSRFLLKKVANKLGVYVEGISKEAEKKLENYNWPGNIRELENVIERALNLQDTELVVTIDQLPERIVNNRKKYYKKGYNNLKCVVANVEKEIIEETLKVNKGNKNKTANQLGISRVGLYKKIERYNLDMNKLKM